MKLFITDVDTIKTKLFAKDVQDAKDILLESSSNYYTLNGKLVYEFDGFDNVVYDVYIKEVEIKRGIIT